MGTRLAVLSATLLVTLAAVRIASAAPPPADQPWFGLHTPEARQRESGAARVATLSARDFPPLSLHLPARDDPYRGIGGEEIFAYLKDVLRITTEQRVPGERFWGRIAGSVAERATAEYMARRFREFGLVDVRTEPVQGQTQWWPVNWSVTLIGDAAYGPGSADIALNSAFPALQLTTGALSVQDLAADLVYVGLGHPADLVGRDLSGKIVVVYASQQPDPFFQTARGYIENLVRAGAVGVLTVMDAPGNYQYTLENMGPPDVPCFVLGGDDARFLLDVIGANGAGKPVRARLSLQTEVRQSWQGENAVGRIAGRSDEYVIVLAHLDGYFESANDNAGGIASVLAMSRYFARAGAPRRNRNLLFVGTSGHHESSDGVAAFIAAHAELRDKTVFVINIEHPSSVGVYFRGALKFKNFSVPGQLMSTTVDGTRSLTISNGNPLLLAFYREAIDRYGIVINASAEHRPPTGEAFGFFRAGYPVAQIIDSNLWYHSSGDTLDTIDARGLERATRAYTLVLDRLDGASRAELSRH